VDASRRPFSHASDGGYDETRLAICCMLYVWLMFIYAAKRRAEVVSRMQTAPRESQCPYVTGSSGGVHGITTR
jgi:hypothetical protein